MINLQLNNQGPCNLQMTYSCKSSSQRRREAINEGVRG